MNAPTDPTATPDLQARYDVLLAELRRERAEVVKVRAELAAARAAQDECGPTEIAMGHGMVDVGGVVQDGRHALMFKQRGHFAPVGAETAPVGTEHHPKKGDVLIWLDGPELGATIRLALDEAEAKARAALPPTAPEAPTDGR